MFVSDIIKIEIELPTIKNVMLRFFVFLSLSANCFRLSLKSIIVMTYGGSGIAGWHRDAVGVMNIPFLDSKAYFLPKIIKIGIRIAHARERYAQICISLVEFSLSATAFALTSPFKSFSHFRDSSCAAVCEL